MHRAPTVQTLATGGTAIANRSPLLAGTRVGAWRIECSIGSGATGTVYAVVHDTIGKRAAMKVIHRPLVTTSNIDRTLLEARVVNRVGHPNIVDIFEVG